MGILPVLIIIIVIASVVSNYNKIAKQRMADEKKRAEKRQSKKNAINAEGNVNRQARPTVTEMTFSEPIQKVVASSRPSPRVSAKEMQRAVITAEILNKPVSLREK